MRREEARRLSINGNICKTAALLLCFAALLFAAGCSGGGPDPIEGTALGDWAGTKMICAKDEKPHDVKLRITKIESDPAVVEKEINAYNLSGYGETLSTDPGADELEYRIAYYDVKFPKDFPEGEEGIMDVFPVFTVTSEAGETTITMDNVKYEGLNDTIHISRPEQGYGFYAGSTYHGKLVFRMVKGCDAYRLVQLYDTEDGDTVKTYFQPDPSEE